MPHQLADSDWDLPEVPVVDADTGAIVRPKAVIKHPLLKDEDIKSLAEYLQSKGLPATPDIDLAKFLRVSDFDVQKAKKRLKAFHARRVKGPELFVDWDVNLPNIQQVFSDFPVAVMPRRTPQNHRVVVISPASTDPSKFVFVDLARVLCMVLETFHLTDPAAEGLVWIYDMKNVVFGHVLRLGWKAPRKFRDYIQDAFPIKMLNTHMINSSSIIEQGLKLVRSVGESEDWARVHVHKGEDLSLLHELLPLECLPSDFGGTLPSLVELQGMTLQRLDAFKKIFARQLSM